MIGLDIVNTPISSGPDLVFAAVARNKGERFFTKEMRDKAYEAAKDAAGKARCEYCKKVIDRVFGKKNSYEADHRFPYPKGGSTTQDNLAPSCRTCNREKGGKTIEEWLGD